MSALFCVSNQLAYANQGQVDNAIEVLGRGSHENPHDRGSFYTCLTWLYLKQVRLGSCDVKSEFYRKAMETANQAFSLDPQAVANILARGVLMTFSGKPEQALSPFQSVIDQDTTNLYGHLGRARVLYLKKDFLGALQIYQNILSSQPDLKPDVRIGIGLCYWQLGDKETAFVAWERAATRNSSNHVAQLLMGLYLMDKALQQTQSPGFVDKYALAMKYIQAAYALDKNYPPAALGLAGYFFSKKNYETVIKLATKILDYTNVPSLIVDGYFYMARAHEAMGHVDKALELYHKCEDLNPRYLAARLAKAVIQVHHDETGSDAIFTCEAILNDNPKCSEACLLLGLLYINSRSQDVASVHKASILLEKYVRLCKETGQEPVFEALATLARLYESRSLTQSLAYLEMMKSCAQSPLDKCKVTNNYAVVQYSLGDYDGAGESFAHALELACGDGNDNNSPNLVTTIKYNLARLKEARGHVDEAKTEYQQILDRMPEYAEAKIRLAQLSTLDDAETGRSLAQSLMQMDPANLEIRAFYGWFLKRVKTSTRTPDNSEQSHYKSTLVTYNKHDTYSLVAMGNLYLSMARETDAVKPAERERREKSYFKASELFDKAIQLDPKNAYAAQGIAIIFAETKRAETALGIFSRVKETLDDISVYRNAGHCLAELRQYSKAIEFYDFALARYKNKVDLELFVLLGRAWYARGMSESSLEAMGKALEYSKKALELAPDKSNLKFNVAFVHYQQVDLIRRANPSTITSEQVEKCALGLEEAIDLLNQVVKAKDCPFPPQDLEQRALMGQNTLRKQLERTLKQQREFEGHTQSKLESARQRRKEENERQALLTREREEQERKREEKLAEERRALQDQARVWAERARQEAELEEELSSRKRQGKGAGSSKNKKASMDKEDTFIVHDEDDDGSSSSASSTEGQATPKKRRLTNTKSGEAQDELDSNDEDLF